MLKHGAFLNLHNPVGGFRFLKPIFTYWVVLPSYVIFRISEFSSRFPFLLAAGMVLWLTYRTTLLAFKQKEIALLEQLVNMKEHISVTIFVLWKLMLFEIRNAIIQFVTPNCS